MEKSANKRRPRRVSDLFHQQTAILEDVLHSASVLARRTHVYTLGIVDDAVLNNLLKLFLGHAKGWLHFVQGVHEIRSRDLDVLDVFESRHGSHLKLS